VEENIKMYPVRMKTLMTVNIWENLMEKLTILTDKKLAMHFQILLEV